MRALFDFNYFLIIISIVVVVWILFSINRMKWNRPIRKIIYALFACTIVVIPIQLLLLNHLAAYNTGNVHLNYGTRSITLGPGMNYSLGPISNWHTEAGVSGTVNSTGSFVFYLFDSNHPENQYDIYYNTTTNAYGFTLPYLYSENGEVSNWFIFIENQNQTNSLTLTLTATWFEDIHEIARDGILYWIYMPLVIITTLWVSSLLSIIAIKRSDFTKIAGVLISGLTISLSLSLSSPFFHPLLTYCFGFIFFLSLVLIPWLICVARTLPVKEESKIISFISGEVEKDSKE